MTKTYLAAAAVIVAMATGAQAATVTLTTVDDGLTGQNVVMQLPTVTNGTAIGVAQSGSLLSNGIFEFDLSSIGAGATINSVSFTWTNTRFISNTGGNPAQVDLFAFAGDGSVTDSDHTTAGVQVADTSVPGGGSAGDTDTVSFADLSVFPGALTAGFLTLRFETDSFASINVAALENTTFDAARLTVDFTPGTTPPAVPLPAGLPLMLAGLGAFAWVRRRQQG
ncbi:MAG: VPLPA-CTERM sorting domain-containing protein [Pseudomonadota bacterium]